MWSLTIENIAGIRSGMATFEPGVNVVQASNWQGKSSLIQAFETVFGTATPLTVGTDYGHVQLETEDRDVEVELVRRNGAVHREGEHLLQAERDRACADLFATLGETNPIRHAVRNGEDLEGLLTRPLDLENIDERIADLCAERDRVEGELDRASSAAERLPAAQERVTQLERDLRELRAERDRIAGDTSGDPAASREVLSEKRAARAQAERTVERQQAQRDQLEERLEERRSALEDLEIPDAPDVADRLAEKREVLRDVESKLDLLRTVYNANRRVLEEDHLDLLADVERSIDEDTLTCWMCGERAERDAFESRLAAVDDRIGSLRQHASDLEAEVESLQDQRDAVERKRQRKCDLEAEVESLETRLAERSADLEAAEERLDRLASEVEELTHAVDAVDEELTDVESEVKYTEAELTDAREELAELERAAEQRDDLSAERDDLAERIERLRTRKERVKRETREAFDDAMAGVLETFEPGFEGARLTASFELVVARDGREVGIDALSEGEVELLGIVTALAGHEAFDVEDRIPIILLDGLGALAGENLHRLVEDLRDRCEFLVTTAYPEQGEFDGHTVTPEEWTTVSDEVASSPPTAESP